MDHILADGNGLRLPPVPYLSQLDYDSACPFSECPSLHGLSTGAFLRLKLGRDCRAAEETAAFLQTWLCFGLTSSALELPVKSPDFVDYSQDPPMPTTREALPRYLKDFEKLSDFKTCERMEEILEEARVCVRFLDDPQTAGSEAVPLLVLLSIMVFVATLETTLHDTIEITHDGPRTTILDWGMSKLFRDRLLERGWCPEVMRDPQISSRKY